LQSPLPDASSMSEEKVEVAPLARTMERASYRFVSLSLSFILAIVSLIGEWLAFMAGNYCGFGDVGSG